MEEDKMNNKNQNTKTNAVEAETQLEQIYFENKEKEAENTINVYSKTDKCKLTPIEKENLNRPEEYLHTQEYYFKEGDYPDLEEDNLTGFGEEKEGKTKKSDNIY